MMQNAKIRLSEEELELMQNSAWILTKNSIIDKVSHGFHILGNRLSMELLQFSNQLPAEVFQTSFKISKGEKYKGLPYLVLDYPRVFGKEDILAIRILFWWGNYYSVTLHCRGKYGSKVVEKLRRFTNDIYGPLFISCTGDEWNHDLESRDYFLWDETGTRKQTVSGDGFIKLSLKTGLTQWDQAEEILYAQYQQLLKFLKD